MNKGHLQWLSLLRGLNILLVVMFHVQLVDMQTGQNHPFCTSLPAMFTPLRMPLFIFLSGGLLYLSRISRKVSVKDLYADKARRILLPFLFFVPVYYFIKVLMAAVVKSPQVFSWTSLLRSFIVFEGQPSAPLWFLATLSVLMLLYPLWRWLCVSNVRMAAFWVFSVLIYFVDTSSLNDYNYFYLLRLNHYMVFFFSGIFFFRNGWWQRLQHPLTLVGLVVLYALLYWQGANLVSSLVGIAMAVALSQLLARWWPRLFSSFREYIFQIYLLSFIFQAFVELVLWRRLFYNEHLFLVFYVLNILFGIYGPVLTAHIVERCPWRWLRLCFGLKS